MLDHHAQDGEASTSLVVQMKSLAAACRCGGFTAVGPADRRYRLIAARAADRRLAAATPQQRRTAGKCGQCHVVS